MDKDKTVDIMIQCASEDEELIKIPIELFTRIQYMAICQDKTFEELFIEIIEEEIRNDEKSD